MTQGRAAQPSRRLTNVSMAAAFVLAVAGTLGSAAFILLMLKDVDEIPVRVYFVDQGWIPWAILFLFWLGLSILVLKVPSIQRQRRAFPLADAVLAIRARRTRSVAARSEDSFDTQDALRMLDDLAPRGDEVHHLMLLRRLERALRRLVNTRSSSEVDDILKAMSDVDRAVVDASYTSLRFLAGVIPILGFLGTVFGIGVAITGFSDVLKENHSFSAVQPVLKQVAHDLGIAFNTTLVALVGSGVLLLFHGILEKREEDLLSEIDDYLVDRILSRMHVVSADVAELKASLDASTQQVVGAVERQGKGLRDVLAPLDDKVDRISGEVAAATDRLAAELRRTLEEIGRDGEDDRLAELAGSLLEAVRGGLADVERQLGELVRAQAAPAEELRDLARRLEAVVKGMEGLGDLGGAVGRLEEAMARLAPAMEGLSTELAAKLRGLLTLLLKAQVVAGRMGHMGQQDVEFYRRFDYDGFLNGLFDLQEAE